MLSQLHRPFPWLCPTCLEQEVYLKKVSYTLDVNHKGKLYEITIPNLVTPQCDSCKELLFTEDSDDQVNLAFEQYLKENGIC